MSAVLPANRPQGTEAPDARIPFAPTVSLVALARSYLYDTTLNAGESPGTSTVGTRAGDFIGGTSVFFVEPTTQPVTVFEEELQPDGTWLVTNNNGAGDVVAAGVHQRFFFRPMSDEHRAYTVNGATGPSALKTDGHWTPIVRTA